MVNTNWRWGTSWQTAVGIHSPVVRVRRWWQAGHKWRLPPRRDEGEKPLVAAVRAVQPGESGGEIAAAGEGANSGAGAGSQWPEGSEVARFVVGEEVRPRVVDNLPEGRGAGRRGSKERVCDTLDLEVRYMRRAFGPLWPLLLKRAGFTGIERRKDMTRLVESMLALGL